MIDDIWMWVLFALVFVVALIGNWGMALMGHPEAVWFWHDVLGLL